MDSKLLERTRNKLKDELSSEEQEVLRKCSSTINTHTLWGSILGGALSSYGMYRRKLWPMWRYWGRGLFFGVGGIIVGMKLGLVSASIQCIRIVQASPNPDHIMKALREVQVELQDARRRPLSAGREWAQKEQLEIAASDPISTDRVRSDETSFKDALSVTENEYASGSSLSSDFDWSSQFAVNQDSTSSTKKETTSLPGRKNSEDTLGRTANIWQQIRGDNGGRPETAWDRLRGREASAQNEPDTKNTGSQQSVNETSQHIGSQIKLSNYDQQRAREQREFDNLLAKERN